MSNVVVVEGARDYQYVIMKICIRERRIPRHLRRHPDDYCGECKPTTSEPSISPTLSPTGTSPIAVTTEPSMIPTQPPTLTPTGATPTQRPSLSPTKSPSKDSVQETCEPEYMSAISSGTFAVQAGVEILSDACMKVFETTLEETANSVRKSAQNILVSNMLSQTENGVLVELTYQQVMVQLCTESCQSSDHDLIGEFMELMVNEFKKDSFTNMLQEQAKDCSDCCVELEDASVLAGTMNIESVKVITSSRSVGIVFFVYFFLVMFISHGILSLL